MDSESEVKSNGRFRLESDAESELKPPSQPKKYTGDDAWLNDRFSRLLLTTFHDGNVKHFNGEEHTEANEIDMSTSDRLIQESQCYSTCT